jgi:hypothetical protein
MAVIQGDQFMLEVETAVPATYVVVNDMNAFSKSSQRNSQTFPVFQRATPHSVAGPREQTYTFSGYLNPTDAGQLRLFAMEAANTTVKIRVTHDGTNGFTQLVRITTYTYDADPENLQEVSFECTADDTAVIQGTGPLL